VQPLHMAYTLIYEPYVGATFGRPRILRQPFYIST